MSTVTLTEKNFPETVKTGIVVIDWWASWCGPCRAFAPIYEAAAKAHAGIVFGKVNTEEEPQLSAAFGIRSIPTLMIFRDGILLFAQPGMVAAEDIAQLLEETQRLDMDDVRRKIVKAEKAEAAKEPARAESAPREPAKG